jgi:hypothetical protein
MISIEFMNSGMFRSACDPLGLSRSISELPRWFYKIKGIPFLENVLESLMTVNSGAVLSLTCALAVAACVHYAMKAPRAETFALCN